MAKKSRKGYVSKEKSFAGKDFMSKNKIRKLINFEKNNDNVKVSVVIPICNVEQYLRECLDKTLEQTLKEIELICVNDGSKDNSLSILEEYAKRDERVKVIDKENSGYGHTMNLGMQMARGKYIGIIESDDYADIHMYEDLYKVAEENDLDWVKGDFYRFFGEGKSLKKNLIEVAARARDLYNKVTNAEKDARVFKLVMQTWSGIYKKEFLESNNIKHHESPGASYQDNGFWFQTLIYGKRIMFVNKPYYMNRRDNPNSSVYDKKKVYAMNREYEYINGILKKNDGMEDKFIKMLNFKKYINYIFTFNRIADEFKWEYLLNSQKELAQDDKNGLIDWDYYDDVDRDALRLILNHPEEYYKNYYINRELIKESNALKQFEREKRDLVSIIKNMEKCIREKDRAVYRVRDSRSFKIGSKMTALPRYIKDRHGREEYVGNNKVHIAYILDDGYAMPTTVSMSSLKQSKDKESIYTVHILGRNLSNESKNYMRKLESDDFKIDIIDVSLDKRFENYTKGDGDLHVTPSAILKFQLPVVLNKVGKVLYIDGDTVVQKDLRALYNTKIDGKYAAVVKDIISERNPKHLKSIDCKNKYYFNSGMMLLNLTSMRKNNVTDRLIEYRLNGKNHFMDQDALNVVFGNKVVYVSPRYNYLNKFYDWWDGERLTMFYGECFPCDAKKALKNATIIHFGSHEKPWIYEMGDCSRIFDVYYKNSPYKRVRLNRVRMNSK